MKFLCSTIMFIFSLGCFADRPETGKTKIQKEEDKKARSRADSMGGAPNVGAGMGTGTGAGSSVGPDLKKKKTKKNK
jgi:hypothetical protein